MENTFKAEDVKFVVGAETNSGFGLSEFIGFYGLLSISNTGSLKITFNKRQQPIYVSLDFIDSYKIKSIKYTPVLIFTKDFNLEKAADTLRASRLKAVEDHIEYYKRLKIKYEKIHAVKTLGITTQLNDNIFEHPSITTPWE